MVDYSDIRHTSPSVTFFFTCLGAFIGFSSEHCPQIGDFALGDSSLSLVLGDLYLLLCQSLGWFELVRGVLRRENMSSEVRSSDLEADLSSSTGTGGVETEVCFYEVAFLCGLRFHVHLFIMELFHCLNIGQDNLCQIRGGSL